MAAIHQLSWNTILVLSCVQGFQTYNIERQAQRIDDLEFKLLTEGHQRRADIFDLRKIIETLEMRLKDHEGEFENHSDPRNTTKKTLVMTCKNTNRAATCESFKRLSVFLGYLKKGFQDEKAISARTRRSVALIDSAIDSLEDNTEIISMNIERINGLLEHVANTVNESIDSLKYLMDEFRIFPPVIDRIVSIKDTLNIFQEAVSRPKSCLQLLQRGHTTSGLYKIYPGTWTEAIKVYCDQETDGGGWIVFQRREDGFLDFYRGWIDYKLGFGNLLGEFWLGNENIYHLTAGCCHELRIELADFRGNQKYAKYSKFQLGPKSGNYVLTVEGYSGDAGDSLGGHKHASFSTKDNGNSKHCSTRYKGGWWYTDCHSANLNGLYLHGNHTSFADGIEWYHWTGHHYSHRFVEMKFREILIS